MANTRLSKDSHFAQFKARLGGALKMNSLLAESFA